MEDQLLWEIDKDIKLYKLETLLARHKQGFLLTVEFSVSAVEISATRHMGRDAFSALVWKRMDEAVKKLPTVARMEAEYREALAAARLGRGPGKVRLGALRWASARGGR
jgi:hypothetical protein